MADEIHVHEGTEGGELEHSAERDLGRIENELAHLVESVEEHTETLKGYGEDRRWMTERLEALERDLAAIPRVPAEITNEFASTIASLQNRIAALEREPESESETKAPPKHERESERETEHTEHERDREPEKRHRTLDRIF